MLINNFKPIISNNIKNLNKPADNDKNDKSDNASFVSIMQDTIQNANNLQKTADAQTADYIAGKNDNLHEVMISMQKADVAMSFVIEVKNRVVDAYKEFSRMQV